MKGKRLLALFLAASVFMTNGSIAFAAESDIEINYQETVSYGASGEEQTEEQTYGEFSYTEYNGTATITYPDGTSEKIEHPAIITKYNGSSEIVEIPGTINKNGKTLTVIELEDALFYKKTGVKKVIIPEKVASIGEYPEDIFRGTSDLEEIQVSDSNKTYYDQDGVLFRIGASSGLPMLMKYPEAKQGESYTVPNDTYWIYEKAFVSCSYLNRIIVPSNVSSIRGGGFYDMSGKTIILQQSDPSKINLVDRCFGLLTDCKIIVQNEAMKKAVENDVDGHEPYFECTNTVAITMDDPAAAPYLTKAESLTFTDGTTEKSITLHPGENYPLHTAYRMEPADATENVTWTNTDDAIAKLMENSWKGEFRGSIEASGQVNYALTTGTTTFTGKDESGHTLTLYVTVDAPVESMILADYRKNPNTGYETETKITNETIDSGEKVSYFAYITPGCNLSIPKTLCIESSNENVAAVTWIDKDDWSNKNPQNEEYNAYHCWFGITALSPGTTTITATLDDNGTIWTDSFELTVTEPEQESDPAPTTPAPGQTPSVPVTPTPATPDPVVPTPPATPGTTTQTKPAKMKTPTVKAGKKKLTVSWKKAKNADGYQIQYSTNGSFKKVKSLNCSKKTSKTTIKKLKSGKKYYIRIRAYKKVNGRKYYGNWSKIKSVKVK